MNGGELNITPYLEKLGKLSAATGEQLHELMKQEATLFVWNSGKIPGVINITPPFSVKTKDAASALAAGRMAVRRDLGNVFSPVTIKGQRTIKQAFGRPMKKPVTVTTKERWPDVAAIAKERWKRKNETGRKVMTRGQRDAGAVKQGMYYVDRGKLLIVMRESYALIGLACSAWYLAAVQSGLRPRGVPSWIKRHTGGFGAGRIETSATSIRITLSSSLNYNTALSMQDKTTRVLGYRQGALERRLPYVLAAAAKRAGFTA